MTTGALNVAPPLVDLTAISVCSYSPGVSHAALTFPDAKCTTTSPLGATSAMGKLSSSHSPAGPALWLTHRGLDPEISLGWLQFLPPSSE